MAMRGSRALMVALVALVLTSPQTGDTVAQTPPEPQPAAAGDVVTAGRFFDEFGTASYYSHFRNNGAFVSEYLVGMTAGGFIEDVSFGPDGFLYVVRHGVSGSHIERVDTAEPQLASAWGSGLIGEPYFVGFDLPDGGGFRPM